MASRASNVLSTWKNASSTIIMTLEHLNLALLCKNLETSSFVGSQPILCVHFDLEKVWKRKLKYIDVFLLPGNLCQQLPCIQQEPQEWPATDVDKT